MWTTRNPEADALHARFASDATGLEATRGGRTQHSDRARHRRLAGSNFCPSMTSPPAFWLPE